ncbi:hypothetical protein J4457_01935 [Candidatus Woesearchaeota archaeon]|nr:hypothetical protein [Candidatus Woesearchaeota archaeon]
MTQYVVDSGMISKDGSRLRAKLYPTGGGNHYVLINMQAGAGAFEHLRGLRPRIKVDVKEKKGPLEPLDIRIVR